MCTHKLVDDIDETAYVSVRHVCRKQERRGHQVILEDSTSKVELGFPICSRGESLRGHLVVSWCKKPRLNSFIKTYVMNHG